MSGGSWTKLHHGKESLPILCFYNDPWSIEDVLKPQSFTWRVNQLTWAVKTSGSTWSTLVWGWCPIRWWLVQTYIEIPVVQSLMAPSNFHTHGLWLTAKWLESCSRGEFHLTNYLLETGAGIIFTWCHVSWSSPGEPRRHPKQRHRACLATIGSGWNRPIVITTKSIAGICE